MDRILSESAIVRAVAQAVAQRISRQVIASLQATKDTLSGDDTVLTSIWDEICVQVQDEESFFWEAYDDTVRGIVGGHVAELPDFEREAMWLQTDVGIEWGCDEPDDREAYPIADGDLIDYLVREYVYAKAANWSDPRIETYTARSSALDLEMEETAEKIAVDDAKAMREATPPTALHSSTESERKIHELQALARKHWAEWLPDKVKELKAEGCLNEELEAAASLAQTEIEHLMKQGYSVDEAREVALALFILLKPEDHPDEQDEEEAEAERDYQKNVAPYLTDLTDQPDEELEESLKRYRAKQAAEALANSKVSPEAASSPMPAPPKTPPESKEPDFSPSYLEELKARNPGAWMEAIIDRDQIEAVRGASADEWAAKALANSKVSPEAAPSPMSFVMMDEPSPFYQGSPSSTLATWEQHLKEVEALPDTVENKRVLVASARREIERLKRQLALYEAERPKRDS